VNSTNRFIEGDNLVAHKARILLQLALTRTSDLKEIQRIFNEY
jgi:L-asparaginase/Glu-tRNA(Gln) amidotransferase subunit D